MSRSFAQPTTIVCPACKRGFETPVWLIADLDEQPDLIESILNETIHLARCPHCGTAQSLDAPLLVHRRSDQLLLFAPAEGSTDEQAQTAARQLGLQLISNIPPTERQPYLTQAQIVRGISGLRVALALAHQRESDELSAALPALMATSDIHDLRRVLADHPVLATPDALTQLREYVQQLATAGHDQLAHALNERVGAIERGTATPQPTPRDVIQALLEAEGNYQRRAVLQHYATAITPEVPPVLAALADQAERQQLDAVARDLRVMRDEVDAFLQNQRS